MAVGMAICTENLINWKNAVVRHIIHDGRPDGIARGCLLHVVYSVSLTVAGTALVRLNPCSWTAVLYISWLPWSISDSRVCNSMGRKEH